MSAIGTTDGEMTIAGLLDSFLRGGLPVRFSAYDGSEAGPSDTQIHLELCNARGLSYLLTAPGDLGFARAYVSGDLLVHGAPPGDPYAALTLLMSRLEFRTPSFAEAVGAVRGLGVDVLKPPPVPHEEHPAKWRRVVEGVRHSMSRDAEAISHHYDVSNRFYELVLGASMTYTCAVFPRADATLEEAQTEKYDLIARKLDLQPGQRLLDVGCGWGGMVRHAAREYGVHALGVTLSEQQANWAAQAIERDGLGRLAQVRHSDYRQVRESGFDAVSSIGLTEHIGVRSYPGYFAFLRDRLAPQGRLLNHCITRPHNRPQAIGAFLDRYIFPDGELTGSGRIITQIQDAGLEVMHEENLRPHYARTLADWCANLVEHWDECVIEAGEVTARAWGLYLAGSRLSFERNEIQLHQVLAVRTDDAGASGYPLRPDF